ncbi:fimbrial protein [Aquitalea aquatica]|uniref:Type 1 fimbrial protein n=1 Tax=Aquitalea aquatica TaxID=3044273 RepID=A0A838XYM5_9NEIS|nr:fimbrial protein [Aquitalea magnusonii]MBA4707486.1 type 1 fimbrial protein [Aquitalea magnusonii]
MRKTILFIAALLLAAFWLGSSQARCAPWIVNTSSASNGALFLITDTKSGIASNQPNFTAISGWSSDRLVSPLGTCDMNGGGFYFILDGTTSPPLGLTATGMSSAVGSYSESGVNYPVYPSSVPGIGFIIKQRIVSPASATVPGGTAISFTPTASQQSFNSYIAGKLIKTGDIGNVNVSAIRLPVTYTLTFTGRFAGEISTASNSFSGTAVGNYTVQNVSCTVNTSSLQVTLASIAPTDLPGLNSTAKPTPFNLGLTCPSSTSVAIYMTLTDNNNPGNTGNLLSLSPGSSASGVNLQILRNSGTPTLVNFGADSSAAGNLNQLLMATGATGSQSFPFLVRYIRTGTLSGGSVNGLATFTMSYQ